MSGDCERARQWASTGLDGELSEFEQAFLEGHLSGCLPCREFSTGIGGVTRELRAAQLVPFEGLVQLARVRRRSRLRLAPAVAALAVAAVGLGSILASSDIRLGRQAAGTGESSGVRQGPSFATGPVNNVLLQGLNRVNLVIAAPTVDTSAAQRLASGGLVLK